MRNAISSANSATASVTAKPRMPMPKTWSRAEGFKQVKGLMDEAADILDRAALTAAGYTLIDCLCDFSEAMSDPDGVTKHGVQRYRMTIMEA